MRLDNDRVLELCRMQDPLGVVSIYAETTPERQTKTQPEWTVAIRAALRDLRHRVKAEGPRERWVAVHRRLDELAPKIEDLLDPKGSGRGRAIFIPVGGDEIETVALQLPLPDTVVIEEHAYIRPLVEALDRGRATGVAFVDRSGLRLLEWRFGEVEELANHPFVDQSSEWREMKGPAAGNPAMAQAGAPQHDTFEERLDDHRVRFLRTMAGEVQKEFSGRNWDRIVVAGEGRLAKPFTEALGNREAEVLRTEHDLRHASAREVEDTVLPLLRGADDRRHEALVVRVKELALSGGQGSLGLADTLAALGEGRVQHLLYDDARNFAGYRAEDGRLFASPEGAGSEVELIAEPHLAERMIERTLQTGGRVTPVENDAAAALAEHEGVAAILRW